MAYRQKSDLSKTNVAIFFGGNSVEHEISVISALQAMQNFDLNKYRLFPIYISKSGQLYYSQKLKDINLYRDLKNVIKNAHKVTFVADKLSYSDILVSLFDLELNQKIDIIDVALPIVHGTNVEDGTIAGYLNLLGLPYAGCDIASASLSMDKWTSKLVMQSSKVSVLDGLELDNTVTLRDEQIRYVEKKFKKYPVIVKPVNLGSSIGISVADDSQSLNACLDYAYQFCDRVLVERAVQNLREINIAVLGDKQEQIVSVCEEPIGSGEILTFEDKYLSGSGKSGKTLAKSGKFQSSKVQISKTPSKTGSKSGMASLSRKIPADLSIEQKDKIVENALNAFKALGCHGVARIDFIIDNDSQQIYLNEINTVPGSLAFYLFEPLGITYTDMLNKLIDLAFKRQRDMANYRFSFETNVLQSANI